MVTDGNKNTTKGRGKAISDTNRLDMCAIIAPRLKYRDSNEDLLLVLEDKGYDIGLTVLKELKKQLRESLKERFKAIGEYELAEEHTYAIEMMKDLMVTMKTSLSNCENQREKVAVVAQIQSLQKDLIDYYGSVEIVENVFKYFNTEEEEETKEKVKQVSDKVKKKVTKKTKEPMMTTF